MTRHENVQFMLFLKESTEFKELCVKNMIFQMTIDKDLCVPTYTVVHKRRKM
jgi:hypothetical protein